MKATSTFFMRLFSLGFFCIFFSPASYALSGTYTVGAGYDYANLAAVAADLNGNTITSDCVFELQSNYTEESSPSITFTTWSGNATYTVTIRPAANVSSMLIDSGRPGSYAPLINLDGAQHV